MSTKDKTLVREAIKGYRNDFKGDVYMKERIESKLRRIALDRSGKYEFGLLSWVRMDDNIYATFVRRDRNGEFMKIYEVYKIDSLI